VTRFAAPPITTDANLLKEGARDVMAEELPGWEPADASPECVIIDAFAPIMAEQAEATKLEMVDAFRGLGPLVGVVPIPAQSAFGELTVTLAAAAPTGGLTIAANEVLVSIRDANGDPQVFRLAEDIVIAEGLTVGSGTA